LSPGIGGKGPAADYVFDATPMALATEIIRLTTGKVPPPRLHAPMGWLSGYIGALHRASCHATHPRAGV